MAASLQSLCQGYWIDVVISNLPRNDRARFSPTHPASGYDQLDARYRLRVAPNRLNAPLAGQISPLHAIRGRHLGRRYIGGCPRDAAGLI